MKTYIWFNDGQEMQIQLISNMKNMNTQIYIQDHVLSVS